MSSGSGVSASKSSGRAAAKDEDLSRRVQMLEAQFDQFDDAVGAGADGAEETSDGMGARIAALETMLAQMSSGGPPPPGGGPRQRKTYAEYIKEWYEAKGVSPYPSPFAEDRTPINASLICKDAGWSMEGAPKGNNPIVGPDCPACKAALDVTKWFYPKRSSDSELETLGQASSETRPKYGTPERKTSGLYHRALTCPTLYKKAHELAKKNPSKAASYFAKPRDGQDAFSA